MCTLCTHTHTRMHARTRAHIHTHHMVRKFGEEPIMADWHVGMSAIHQYLFNKKSALLHIVAGCAKLSALSSEPTAMFITLRYTLCFHKDLGRGRELLCTQKFMDKAEGYYKAKVKQQRVYSTVTFHCHLQCTSEHSGSAIFQ